MNHPGFPSRSQTLWLAVVLLGLLPLHSPARARQVPTPPEELAFLAAELGTPEATEAPGELLMTETQLHLLAFGSTTDPASVRHGLEERLGSLVDELTRNGRLRDDQRFTLRLAGEGDIKRYFDQVAERRRRHVGRQYTGGQMDALADDLKSLQDQRETEIFGADSLLQKCLRGTLDPAQQAAIGPERLGRRATRFRVQVARCLDDLDRSLRLSPAQQERLGALMVDQIRPFQKEGDADTWAVLYKLAQLPEADIANLLAADQVRALQPLLRQAELRGPVYRERGYFADEPPRAAIAEPAPPPGAPAVAPGAAALRDLGPTPVARQTRGEVSR